MQQPLDLLETAYQMAERPNNRVLEPEDRQALEQLFVEAWGGQEVTGA